MSEVDAKLAEYLAKLEGRVDAAVEFGVEQAPLVVQEFLAWEFWHAVGLMGVALAGLLVAVCVGVLMRVRQRTVALSADNRRLLRILVSIACGICLCVCGVEGFRVLKVTVAPRVVVLEKIGELARGE